MKKWVVNLKYKSKVISLRTVLTGKLELVVRFEDGSYTKCDIDFWKF